MCENNRTDSRVVRAKEQAAELGNWQDQVDAEREYQEELERNVLRRVEQDNDLSNILGVANAERGFPPTIPLDYEESSESSESSSENPERAGMGGKRPREMKGKGQG